MVRWYIIRTKKKPEMNGERIIISKGNGFSQQGLFDQLKLIYLKQNAIESLITLFCAVIKYWVVSGLPVAKSLMIMSMYVWTKFAKTST